MYLKIGEKKYPVSRRVVTDDSIKYLSVFPDPGPYPEGPNVPG